MVYTHHTKIHCCCIFFTTYSHRSATTTSGTGSSFCSFSFFFFQRVHSGLWMNLYATTHTLWGSPHEESLHSHWSPWLPDFCIRLRASQHSARSWRRLSSKARAAQLLGFQEVTLHCTCQRFISWEIFLWTRLFYPRLFNAKNLFSWLWEKNKILFFVHSIFLCRMVFENTTTLLQATLRVVYGSLFGYIV